MSTYSNPLTDYSPQMEFYGGPPEMSFAEGLPRGVLSESEEMELAAEFLEIENEAELDHFLGNLFHKIGHTIGKIAHSPLGQAVGGVLKSVAKTALPIAGGALGGFVGGPIGAMIGSNLASVAGSALGLELEGLSPEDREFEASKQFIRFAGQTAANALAAPPYADPNTVAYEAAVEAARLYAPGLMDIAPRGAGSGTGSFRSKFNLRRPNMNHDIDRTQVGYAPETGPYGPSQGGSVFNEDEHSNLVAGLMEVGSEQELDNFLGDVISGAANAIGSFISSPTGQALGNGLKGVAKQLLPVAGQALGNYVAPGVGGQIGGALGSAAAGMFEAEAEEAEWEAADTFVKLATEAAKNAASMPPGGDPHAVAHQAIVEAAKIHAPALVPALTGVGHGAMHGAGHCGCHHHGGKHHHSGRWYRHGDRIVLMGA